MQRKVVTGTALTLLLIGMLTLAFCFHQVKAEPPLGMISYWKFDEGSETTAYDSVGANHGTVYGASWTTGKVDGALSFDGSNDYVEITSHTGLNMTDAITIEGWFYHNVNTTVQIPVYSSADFQDGGVELYKDNQDGLRVEFQYSGGSILSYSNANCIPKNAWHHFAVTYDTSLASDNVKMFVNANNLSVTNDDNNQSIGAQISTPVIGKSHLGLPNWSGKIDELRIYNRALSPEEIWLHYDITHPNITAVSQTPLANNVLPEDEVKVNATVTDDLSGVKQVTLNYTYTNSSGTWTSVVNMTNPEGNVWNATIPAFPSCTNVTYVIIAEDKANNTITTEELGYEYQYHVIPEFPSFLLLPLLMIATLLTVIVYRRKHSM